MTEYKAEWKQYDCFCPVCGKHLYGYKKSNGEIKMKCDECHIVLIKVNMGRRHTKIDVYTIVN